MEIQQRKRVAITSSFFPVDESLLPQLNISPAQHEELREYALQVALNTIRDGPTWGRSNLEHAVSSGWKVLSARPAACFMTKKHVKKKKKKQQKKIAATTQQDMSRQQQEHDKRAIPPSPPVAIPGVPCLKSFDDMSMIPNPMPCQAFAHLPLETASGQHFMAHAILPNSLEDVMNTLYCEHTCEMRALKRKVYGDVALDCCVLQTLEGATLEDPFWYLGLKWLALRSPMQAFMASREFVYLEHQGTHVDPDTGRRMLYRVTQSVHIRGYGGQDSYFGLTRGHIEAAFVYWMDDENEVRNPLLHVCAKGRIHMKGSMPETLMNRYLKSFWRSQRLLFSSTNPLGSSSLGTTIISDRSYSKKKKKSRRRKVPSGPPLEMAHEWVADELRPRCFVCNKKFHLVGRFKHHCRACGEIMCRECTFQHRVNVRATQSFRGLRGTVAASPELMADTKSILSEEDPIPNFEETMTCSFDKQVEEEKEKGERKAGEFNDSLTLVNARKAVNGPTETAVLGGDSVVCVVMAKVCLRCLQSVPIVNVSKTKSSKQRRHSEVATLSGENVRALGQYQESFPSRPQTWTPDYMELKELKGLVDDQGRMSGGELDLPMLVDTDAESVDGLADTKQHKPDSTACDAKPKSARFNSYTHEWNEVKDAGLANHANSERRMILSPHALLTSSTLKSSQLYEPVDKDESSHNSSSRSEHYSSQHSAEFSSDLDGDDGDSIQFYPTRTNPIPDDTELKPAPGTNQGVETTSLYELQEDENHVTSRSVAISATEKALCQLRGLQDEPVYRNRRLSTSVLYKQ